MGGGSRAGANAWTGCVNTDTRVAVVWDRDGQEVVDDVLVGGKGDCDWPQRLVCFIRLIGMKAWDDVFFRAGCRPGAGCHALVHPCMC